MTRAVRQWAAAGERPFVPIFSSPLGIGGVEAIADHLHHAVVTANYRSALYGGGRQIAASRRPPDAWFAMTWKAHALALTRHPRTARGGFVWTHGAELTRDRRRVLQRLRERSLETSDGLLAVSPLSLELLPRELHPRVTLVGPPISIPDRPLSPAPVPQSGVDRPLQLLSIGRAIPRKGHDKAIAVARRLAKQTPVALRIVGPGPDLPRLRQLAEGSEPALEVQFLGQVDEGVKAHLFDSSDALLFFARNEGTEYEGLGLVVLEAGAHGCPAVVLDCGGSRFTTVDSQTGRLLDQETSVDAIADVVREVGTQPTFRVAARRYAENFGLASWRQRVLTVLQGERVLWDWPSGQLV